MKNKKVIIAVVLGIGAVITVIYGLTAPTKSGGTTPPALQALSANEATSMPRRIMPSKRHAARTTFNFWGKSPFVPEETSVEIKAKLILNGIMWDEKKPLAIIDNEVLGIGGKIDEYTVKDIKKDSVTLNDGINDLELRLAQ